jgi:hypothetical protein
VASPSNSPTARIAALTVKLLAAVIFIAGGIRDLAVRRVRHWQAVNRARGDAGYSTETVLVTALLVTAAVVVLGIITAKVIAKAQSINL